MSEVATEIKIERCERCRWVKYSENALIELEKKILSVVKTTYKSWFVNVGPIVGTSDKIWTIAVNQEHDKVPLVLLHGFAAGIGFWCLNFDEISKDRPVYAIDLLGFGRSSRPTFSKDPEEAEQQMVDSLEEWRRKMKLDKFILLGHSFGGYLAASYAINHPERVKHLILADPWGFAEKPGNFTVPLWAKALGIVFYPFTYFNPLATVRAAGPFGPWLIRKMRSDISEKYESALDDKDIITEYIYQCNSQTPTGETFFHSMLKGFGWCKNPMVKRYDKIRQDIPITVLFGKDSWINKEPGYILKEQRPDSYVNIEIIPAAGHHIHADQPKLFNKIVFETCRLSDERLDTFPVRTENKIQEEETGEKILNTVLLEDETGENILENENIVIENFRDVLEELSVIYHGDAYILA